MTVVAIILIVIIGITAGGRDKITSIENFMGSIITPIQKVFYNSGESVVGAIKSIGSITQLKDENIKLKEENAKLKEQVRNYEDIVSKSDYLRNAAILKEKTKYNLVEAQIIGKDPGNWFERFIIDKGTKDGIKKDDAVIQGIQVDGNTVEEGLVGRVVEVGENWAKVIAIIDAGSNLSFNVIRTQDGGIMKGDSEGNISGYLFDTKADVVKGDKLLTSGLGGIFIKGLYIGEISEVTKNSDDLLVNIEVQPAMNFNKLQNVFVIIGN
ncbi:rod shape-determining protein MreC [Proteiniborus sp. MB09-C3]|uniref:rod shape-determining protein MreC n=1 Tax=Proteiniborus sp. MB09-C3 TaxID=3050072 RepID=UPI0025544DC6|nr:rod shape-determining protein MreC [Proteiniborus sp. MB09-C3]WIV10598.1 rod shape-determining protein MreC [Proteiniborus sp. MB09-C3]